MFVSSNLMGSNCLSIRLVLILNPLLVYMDLTVAIVCVRCFRVLLVMNLMVEKFILQPIVANEGILLTNRIYYSLEYILLDLCKCL